MFAVLGNMLVVAILPLITGSLAATVSSTLVVTRGSKIRVTAFIYFKFNHAPELTGTVAPDCFALPNSYMVNGAWSGPNIFASEGDTLLMTIVNQNDAPLSIHLHGLRQAATPASDGSAFIASAPLAPFETRTVRSEIGDTEAGVRQGIDVLQSISASQISPLISSLADVLLSRSHWPD